MDDEFEDELDELFELELEELFELEFDELFELELDERFELEFEELLDERFELELLDPFDELFEDEFPANCCPLACACSCTKMRPGRAAPLASCAVSEAQAAPAKPKRDAAALAASNPTFLMPDPCLCQSPRDRRRARLNAS